MILDPIRGQAFGARTMLLALKAGEPRRIGHVLAWEALSYAVENPHDPKKVEFLLAEAREIGVKLDDPFIRANT